MNEEVHSQVHSQEEPFTAASLLVSEGNGIRIRDQHGRTYLDAASGYWFLPFGQADPELIDVMAGAAKRLSGWHLFGTVHEPAVRYADELLSKLPRVLRGKVLFGVSGSDAVEIALRVACVLAPSRSHRIAYLERAYHGSTYLCQQLSHFGPRHQDQRWPGSLRLPAECTLALPSPLDQGAADRCLESFAQALRSAQRPTVFISEPIQGAGGVMVPPAGFHARVRDLCDRHDVIWIGDEVGTGFGATGQLLAFEHEGVFPDILVLGKRMGGGLFPISAAVLSARLAAALLPAQKYFLYGHSLSGHPVGCEVARVVLRRITEPGFLERVREVGEKLRTELVGAISQYGRLGPIRGRGLMLSVQIPSGELACRIVTIMRDRGVYLDAEGRYLVFAPPLVIQPSEAIQIVEQFSDGVAELSRKGLL